jgi:hypothetical protein
MNEIEAVILKFKSILQIRNKKFTVRRNVGTFHGRNINPPNRCIGVLIRNFNTPFSVSRSNIQDIRWRGKGRENIGSCEYATDVLKPSKTFVLFIVVREGVVTVPIAVESGNNQSFHNLGR